MKIINSRGVMLARVFILLSVSSSLVAEDEVRLSYDGYMQHNYISGNSPQSSLLTKGWSYNNLFSLYTKGMYQDFDYSINTSVKVTNDKQKDIKKVSLVNLSGQIKNKIHLLELGDYFKSYSKYSLNSSLKGSSYTYNFGDKNSDSLNLTYGIAYARWDSFWQNETESTKRRVLGMRYNKDISEILNVGLDVVKTDDSNSKVSGLDLYDISLYTLNATYKPILGLKIYGEYSYSKNSKNSNSVSSTEKDGGAVFLQAIGNKNPSRVQLEYERISPDFKTVTGSATPDREKFKSTWRYNITQKTILNTGFLWFHDNLNHAKANTTNTYRPNIGLTLKEFLGRQYATVDVNTKLNIIDNNVNKTYDKMYDINYRDRFGIVFSDMNYSYSIYDTNNGIRKQNEQRFNTTFGTRHNFDNFVLKPSLMFGVWDMSDELNNNSDNKYYQKALSVGLDIPKYKIVSNLRFGKNKSTRDSGDNLDKSFYSYDVHWRVGATQTFKDVMLYLKTYKNDLRYTTSSKNYEEESLIAGFKLKF